MLDQHPIPTHPQETIMDNRLAAPVARIAIRYLTGALAYWGLFSPETAAVLSVDPDLFAVVAPIVAAILAAGTEGAYAIARRRGGAT